MKNSLIVVFARFFLYLLFVVGLVYLLALEGFERGAASEYGEASLIEMMESSLALISALLFFAVSRMDVSLRPATQMLAVLCVLIIIREADYYLDNWVFDGAWQMLVGVVLLGFAVHIWRIRDQVVASIQAYLEQMSAGIFLSGFLVLFVFSRLFGRESFWEAVMGDGYMRVVKNIAEEGTEVMGYGLIAIAAVELMVSVMSRRKNR